MTTIMKTLAVRVARYRSRKRAKSRSCSSPKLEKPRNTKPFQAVALAWPILRGPRSTCWPLPPGRQVPGFLRGQDEAGSPFFVPAVTQKETSHWDSKQTSGRDRQHQTERCTDPLSLACRYVSMYEDTQCAHTRPHTHTTQRDTHATGKALIPNHAQFTGPKPCAPVFPRWPCPSPTSPSDVLPTPAFRDSTSTSRRCPGLPFIPTSYSHPPKNTHVGTDSPC